MKRSVKRVVNKIIPLVVLAVVILVLFLTCGKKGAASSDIQYIPGSENNPRYGGVLNYPFWIADSIDPHKSSGWGAYLWATCVFETPLTMDPAGNLMPGVCEYNLSEDNLVLTLWPREGLVFHDGTPVTVADVKASIKRANDCVSQIRNNFGKLIDWDNVKDVVYTDENGVAHNAVEYRYKYFSVNATYYLACGQHWCAIIPARLCEAYGKEKTITEVKDVIGTGPYYLAEIDDSRVTLKRFGGYKICDEYYNGMKRTGRSAPRMAYMDEINIYSSEDALGEAMSFLQKDYDLGTLFGEFLDSYEAYHKKRDTQTVNMHYLAFNTEGNRPVNNVYLRKAIAAAIDYNDINKFLAQSGTLQMDPDMVSFMDKSTPYYDNRLHDADYAGPANKELAKEYLHKAYETGYTGERLYLLTLPSNEIATLIQSMCEDVGIPLDITFLDGGSYEDMRRNPSANWDMVPLRSVQSTYSPSQLVTNLRSMYWKNERKDELYSLLEKVPYASEKSFGYWDEIMQLWAEECPYLVFGAESPYIFMDEDLERNMEGSWEYLWNAYWKHPEKHR